MLARQFRGFLHLLIGAACAALMGWLAWAMTLSLGSSDGLERVVIAALIVLALAIAVAVLLAGPVRAAEVVLARVLLDVELPEVRDSSSAASRGKGLCWALLTIGIGAVGIVLVLILVPQGAWLLIAGFAGPPEFELEPPFTDLSRWLLPVLGLLAIALGVLCQVPLIAALRALAGPVLGPTAADRLAAERARSAQLARQNALARELHDGIGHALTAIGVQAEAGFHVARHDPAFAQRALAQIAAVSRSALDDLDQVLGALRGGAGESQRGAAGNGVGVGGRISGGSDGGGRGDCHVEGARGKIGASRGIAEIPSLVTATPGAEIALEVDDSQVPDEIEACVYRVVQEGLTNAARHGAGPAIGFVEVCDSEVRIDIENPVAEARAGSTETGPGRGRRGLAGLSERIGLLGGSMRAGIPRDPSGTILPGADGRPVWRLGVEIPLTGAR
jgi:signal transduction histidine kinase